ncbi:hypothetical protein F3087_18165 [Nocardia colli]|uniref:Uncharacterized protein n=1 Tax=Nocardia colli TaxID=2545717 RepID=A0A5N0EG79_9NOCA|nr:hypothetical protein [Nocardia colli]KAA8887589.1 hypothetical protein F3087_18165 [Nocardia colli]
MSAEWASAGAELDLTLDLDTATYTALRVEFLAMTAAAQRASGQSKAVVVKRCAGRPGKQTVYNYAGGSGYLSFPKPDLLQRYLESCNLPADQVQFAVDRCARIRRKHPEAGKPGPRRAPTPPIEERSAAELGRTAGTDLPGESGLPGIDVPSDSDLPGTDLPGDSRLPITDLPGGSRLPGMDVPGDGDLPSGGPRSVRDLPSAGLSNIRDLPSEGRLPSIDVPGASGLPRTGLPGVGGLPRTGLPGVRGRSGDSRLPRIDVPSVGGLSRTGLPGVRDLSGDSRVPSADVSGDGGLPSIDVSGGSGLPGIDVSGGSDLPRTGPPSVRDLPGVRGRSGDSRLPSADVQGDGGLPGIDVPGGGGLSRTGLPGVRGLSGDSRLPGIDVSGDGDLPRSGPPSVRDLLGVRGLPLSAQSAGWAGRWRGLVRLVAPRRIVAAVDGAGEPRFVTPLPSTWYGSRASEPWQPSKHALTGAQSRESADRRWVGSELRDSGVRVTPGRLALRIVRAELENAWPRDECNAMDLVRKAYRTLGITLRTRAGEESGVPVPLEQAAPGDILTLVDGRKGLYVGGGWALLLAPAADGANLHGIRHDQIATAHRINWESVPLTRRPPGWGGVWPNVNWIVLSGRPAPINSMGIAPGAADAVPHYAGAGQRQADEGHRPASTVAAGELSASTEAIAARHGQTDEGHRPALTVAGGELPTSTEAIAVRHWQADGVHCPASTVAGGELPASTEVIVASGGQSDVGYRPASTVVAGELPASAEAIIARCGQSDDGYRPALTVAGGELLTSTEAIAAGHWQADDGHCPASAEVIVARNGQADDGHQSAATVVAGEPSTSTDAIVARYWQADDGYRPASTLVAGELFASTEAMVARHGQADDGRRSASTVAGESPSSTEVIVAQYEQLVHTVAEQVEAAGRAAEPGLAALRAIGALMFPYVGPQVWLVREAFKAVDLPLSECIRFELPIMAVALRHVALRPGDIVFTESGVLGFYGEHGELVYLGPAGSPATSALSPALYVAAWRVSAVPAHAGYGLTSQVEVVEHDGAGRLVRICSAGERRSGRHCRCPETDEVMAMVMAVLKRARECAVPMPLTERELLTAAIRSGIQFPDTTAWDPAHKPVFPRDTRLTTAPDALPRSSATAAQQLVARLATAPASRWSRRPRPGVA